MADVIYLGAVGFVPAVKTYTLTGTVAGAKWTVTANGKSVSYTAVASDTNDTAAAVLAAILSAAPYGEISECTSSTDATVTNQITIVGPADGAPFTWTHSESGGAVNTEANPTAADGPHNASNALNYSTGSLPVATNRLVLSQGNYGPKYGLTAFTAVALAGVLVTDGFDNATVGLPDQNPRGYPEYRPKYLEVNTPLLTVSSNQQTTDQRLRFKCTLGAPTAVTLVGPNAVQAGGEVYATDVIGLFAGSTVSASNSSFAVSRLFGLACAVSTISANGCYFYVGPGATVSGAITTVGSYGRLLTSFAGLTVDSTSAVSVELAAACSSGNVVCDGGLIRWVSSGNPSATVSIGNGGKVDFTGAPVAVSVTTFEMAPQSTLDNSTGKLALPVTTKGMRCTPADYTVLMPPNYLAAWNSF